MNAIHVLALDGGGMRGLYTATVLRTLARRFTDTGGAAGLDLGKGFDVVLGTSTGAILAAAIALGIPIDEVAALYENAGPRIFKKPIPLPRESDGPRRKIRFAWWALSHLCRSANPNRELRSELKRLFGDWTFGDLYEQRGIGLCVSATSALKHKPRVFKTRHVSEKDRDDDLSIVEACLASSAAPIYLPLASIEADRLSGQVYADGGLWANNPVLVGLIEGLAVSEPKQPVVVMSVGTCPPTAGSAPPTDLDRGIAAWRAGVGPMVLAMDAQGQAATYAATLLAEQLRKLGKHVEILRCEPDSPSAEQAAHLQLDSASEPALRLMKGLGNEDGQEIYRWYQNRADDRRGQLLAQIFERMPEINLERTPNLKAAGK
ncbi:MAG: patatin-like phospholipase family protein [Gemmatimonadales bacterium]|nr:patatin-like phospholipase family protein [Gemmatimonadales bacterium]MYG50153.1 patatin-like phospholipase family protein [Gemmatimonadales bacterium]MYK01350.1 patatin-like phospholipase family protein [Candidatus Palauibacter ramosifaciens]